MLKGRHFKIRKPFKFNKDNLIYVFIGLLFLIQGVSLILPFLWMILTSFKDLIDSYTSFLGLPTTWHPENYVAIFERLNIEVVRNGDVYQYGVFDMMLNSLIIATFGSLFALLPTVLLSYVCAKYNFRFRKLILSINIFVMVIPVVGTLANTLIIYKQFGIYDNLWLYMILPGIPFGFNFLLLLGTFKAVPKSYSEAVFIDGGGHLTIFLKIIIPLVMPTLITLYVLSFIGRWNDYSSSLLYLPSTPTLAYGMYRFQYDASKYGAILPEILAGFAICSIPSVVLFCSFQKFITKSLTVGGIKE
jgi:ABC-type glycerol-3-phosphate transport system permease component